MKTRIFMIGLGVAAVFSTLNGAALDGTTDVDASLKSPLGKNKIVISNRILVQGIKKPISVIDLVKSMAFVFHMQYPQYVNSMEARYEFYKKSWRFFLEEAINHDLLMAKSEQFNLQNSEGDVRRELEEALGPNFISIIDKMGWSYKDAKAWALEKLTVNKMLYIINRQASVTITPTRIKEAYQARLNSQKVTNIITYQIISITEKEGLDTKALAEKAYELLSKGECTLADLSAKLEAPEETLSISEVYQRAAEDVSALHKEVLDQLTINSYSQPKAKENVTPPVYRIFYLKNREAAPLPSFDIIKKRLEEELNQNANAKGQHEYIQRLRKQYYISDDFVDKVVPKDFEPFALK